MAYERGGLITWKPNWLVSQIVDPEVGSRFDVNGGGFSFPIHSSVYRLMAVAFLPLGALLFLLSTLKRKYDNVF